MKLKILFHRQHPVWASGLALCLAGQPATAAISLANAPLFLTTSVAPNLILTLDDSGSMARAYTPDTIRNDQGKGNGKRFKASYYNPMYYNPAVTYTVPTRRDGVGYSTSFNNALLDGFNSAAGTVDLGSNYKVTFQYYNGSGQCSQYLSEDKPASPQCWLVENPAADFESGGVDRTTSGVPAYYYLFYSQKKGQAKPDNCTDDKEVEYCYIKIDVGSSDDIAKGDSAEQKKQNFANWYSFHRTRALSMMSAAMSAVTDIDDQEVRLGWQTLNNGGCDSFGTTCKGYDDVDRENRLRKLTTSHRSNFYNWLQRFDVGSSTPLRGALKKVGDYFSISTGGTDPATPYAEDPYVSKGTELSCRKNFHILFTDGLWNGNNNVDYGGNLDSTARNLPDSTAFPADKPPFKDGNSNSLADIAFKYWATDLRTDLDNNVQPYVAARSDDAAAQYWDPKNDPASWQHLVNFTIGLGLTSTLSDPVWGGSTYAGDYDKIKKDDKNWPPIDENPVNNLEPVGHVYDLWHAAINSRGQFFSVEEPDAMVKAFRSAVTSILNANPSAAALAANSTSLQTGTLVYQAGFDSRDWHGQLQAFPIEGDGIGDAQWDAAKLIPTSGRKVFTYDGSQGKEFKNCSSDLSETQKLALDTDSSGVVDNQCTARLDWLRGDASKEQRFSGGVFRDRKASVLGDIVNSDPIYVKDQDDGYTGSAAESEAGSYRTFVNAKKTRTPVVYVGANDGMLHAFRADTGHAKSGVEQFAYVPAGVYGRLSQLTSPAYTHTYTVDGAPNVGDAYLSNAWKTVLVGGLGAGGKSVYALDVTDPDNFGAGKVLWEYSDATDLGYTYSQPQIARLNNGQWAAVFGNGYNSASDKAFLYIVNLADGSLIKKIPAGNSTANGLSTPVLHDANGDKIVDAVYAGDLQGKLWKFDLSSNSDSNWAVGNGGNPLFSAKNGSDQVQPITSQPKLGAHPQGGMLVYFGTGRYLTSTDPQNTEVQSFYALRDNGVAGTVTRNNLKAQTIDFEGKAFNRDVRLTSSHTVDWSSQRGWYIDLVSPSSTPKGERVVSPALLKYDRVLFVTQIPSTDPCVPGGESWLMEVGSLSGAATTLSVFDLDNNNLFDDADKHENRVVTGLKSTVGMTKAPVWLEGGDLKRDLKVLSGTSGGRAVEKNRPPRKVRVYWQEIL
ncbi:pilus assembly protein [Crenobacter cavernae]|uniref:PilY1 beta-propeller domain-containing protein n=1 Tax=Crenobacter cavernae TaxID=2290923 RepID=A0A345Y9Y2_9NEIS|nr:PilC/PilY family type IV pilus protein [Crenobacter cavernae]AXK40734.1 hypothetical protein DWG20_15635 [Crenobacter cavernae]